MQVNGPDGKEQERRRLRNRVIQLEGIVRASLPALEKHHAMTPGGPKKSDALALLRRARDAVLYADLQPAEVTEVGWVIEHKNSEPCAPLYWSGNGWSRDHLRAIRFARKEDAERTARGWDEDDPLPHEPAEHRCCEHAWG